MEPSTFPKNQARRSLAPPSRAIHPSSFHLLDPRQHDSHKRFEGDPSQRPPEPRFRVRVGRSTQTCDGHCHHFRGAAAAATVEKDVVAVVQPFADVDRGCH